MARRRRTSRLPNPAITGVTINRMRGQDKRCYSFKLVSLLVSTLSKASCSRWL
jgi:hypothetical protein